MNLNTSRPSSFVSCLLVFLSFLTVLVLGSFLLRSLNRVSFQMTILFTGWFCWTFLEYSIHRFWMHYRDRHRKKAETNSHLTHHLHPTEIEINATKRLFMLLIGVGMIFLSLYFRNYFTVITGLYLGFCYYTFIHYLLHQSWFAKWFAQLTRYHIHHHCKYPEHCFGVSVTWWDKLFGTAPPKEGGISQRIINFYYNKESLNRKSPANYSRD
jgi:sterol desaturase/sphingolipid hydroxylase (fatty acid hydroxylase superfamily)